MAQIEPSPMAGREPAGRRPGRRGALRAALRWLAAAAFVAAGVNHFVRPAFYRQIVPPAFPSPALLVVASGVCEIAGGVGLLVRPLRRAAGWGLVALLVAVFPANVYMAVCPDRIPGLHVAPWLLWLRLPAQGVFVVWVWYAAGGYTRRGDRPGSDPDRTPDGNVRA